jgi:putative isomerase
VLDGQMLSRIATLLGRADEAAALMERADALAARVRERLWDPAREVFSARRWSGEWVSSLAPTSFYPLAAGIATPEQAEALVHRHLLDPERFWGPRPLAATAYDDPATADDVYWRGRIWPPLVFMTWEGLRRAGYRTEAAELAERAWTMFAREWSERRRCRENYKIDPAADPEVDDSDGFYTWGALLALTALLERGDVSPWSGLTLAPGGEVTCGGVAWAMRADGVIERAGEPVLTLSAPVTVRDLEIGETVTFTADSPVTFERV